jgi:hypothetical protein
LTQILVILIGLVVGFAGSRLGRKLRSPKDAPERGRAPAPTPPPSRSAARPKAAASAAGLGRSVGGAFGGRKNLTLPHLQRAAFSELMRHVTKDRQGRTTIPVDVAVLLNPADRERVADAEQWFCSELSKALVSAARDHGWDVPAPPRIVVEADPSRAPGTPGVRVTQQPPPAPAPAPAPPVAPPTASRTALLTRTDDGSGTSHELSGDAVTIGRGSDRDIRVEEARASRSHGTFRPSRSGPGWTYTDDGSSNGTTINGRRVDPKRRQALRDGDRIEIGTTTFTFSTPPPPAPPEWPVASPDDSATQALDERELQDLTGVYFPPEEPQA